MLSWISKILPLTNFLQSKYYISSTKLMNVLQTRTWNYSPSAKWNIINYTWKWHYFCQVILTQIKGLHLIDLKINSLLPKIDELRNIAKCFNVAVIGIIETKLDNTVYDSEVAIEGYSIVRNDRTRKGGGVASYIRSSICYTRKTCLSNNLENIFIDLLFPKTKPISIDIFYKPPSQTRFLEQVITKFESLELNNELYIRGTFNINLLFKGNCILNKTHEIKNHFKDFRPEIKKYNEFCSIYGFKAGLSPYKKNPFYLLQWKPFKTDEKCFIIHLESSFRSQDI